MAERDTAAQSLLNSRTAPSAYETWQAENGLTDSFPGDQLTALEQERIGADFRGGYYGEQIEDTGGGFDPNAPLVQEPESPAPDPLAPSANPEDSKQFNSGSSPDKEKTRITKNFPNVLHDYATYTYSLSLHALGLEEYNGLVKNKEYRPTNVLIASAGRYNDTQGTKQFIRSSLFKEDFYFQNFELETVIGLNERSRNTNAIHMMFTIIEPYGVTLLDRIIETSKNINDGNYLQMPYLLQIDFYGSKDVGVPVTPIPDITKRIPIRILKLDTRVTLSGTEYQIEAVPFNHSAYDETTVSNPVNIEVTASTVAGFFANLEDDKFIDEFKENEQRKETAAAALLAETNRRRYDVNSGDFVSSLLTKTPASERRFTTGPNLLSSLMINIPRERVINTKSYTGALNAWQKYQLKENKITIADVYEFKFDPDIASAKLVSGGKISPSSTPLTDRKNARAQKAQEAGSAQAAELDTEDKIFSINAGSSIEKVLEFVLRSSSYELDQMINRADYETEDDFQRAYNEIKNKPFKTYKIIPTIELLGYDKKTQKLARKITYYVKGYTVKNLRVPGAPGATASEPMKIYNYIYTGQNKDIIDLNLEFNATYYTALTVDRTKLGTIGGPTMEENKSSDPSYNTKTDYFQDPNAIMPLIFQNTVADTQQVATGGIQSAKEVLAADVHKSVYSEMTGDMLELKLKIIGDPLWIKQDEIFYSPDSTREILGDNNRVEREVITANGSLVMDNGEVYCQVTVKTPIDIDETNGMYKFDTKYKTALFSGMYKALIVKSLFENGVFTQELDLVRLPRQTQFDYQNGAKANESDLGRDTDTQTSQANPIIDTTQQDYSSKEFIGPDFTPITTSPDPEVDDNFVGGYDPALENIVENGISVEMTAQNEPYTVAPDFTPISIRGNQLPGIG